MTTLISAYTEQLPTYPAFINVSWSNAKKEDVTITVRDRGSLSVAEITMSKEQFKKFLEEINDGVKDPDTPTEETEDAA